MLEQIYDLERKAIAARCLGDLSAAEAVAKALHRLGSGLPVRPVPSEVLAHAQTAYLSEAVMAQLCSGLDPDAQSQFVRPDVIDDLRAFVAGLTDTDLSGVRVVRSAATHGEEGSAMPCGTHDHVIILSTSGFQSNDVAVHEFGHTAEFMVRRARADVAMTVSHRAVSEAVAYFCQFSYLLAHGTPSRRRLALAAFLPGHLAAQFICVVFEGGRPTPEHILEHPRFAVFRALFSIDDLRLHIAPFVEAQLDMTAYNYVDRLFAIPIALRMIATGQSVRSMMLASIDKPVRESLDAVGIDGASVIDFGNLDALFTAFIDGSIAARFH